MTTLRITFVANVDARSFGRLGEGRKTFRKGDTIEALGAQDMPLGSAIVFRVAGDPDSWVVPTKAVCKTPEP